MVRNPHSMLGGPSLKWAHSGCLNALLALHSHISPPITISHPSSQVSMSQVCQPFLLGQRLWTPLLHKAVRRKGLRLTELAVHLSVPHHPCRAQPTLTLRTAFSQPDPIHCCSTRPSCLDGGHVVAPWSRLTSANYAGTSGRAPLPAALRVRQSQQGMHEVHPSVAAWPRLRMTGMTRDRETTLRFLQHLVLS